MVYLNNISIIISYFFLPLTGTFEASQYCRNLNYKRKRLRCDDGCCGSWPYETCCEEEEEDEPTTWHAKAVISVVGGVIVILLIISLAICGLCLLVKVRGKKGRVIQPSRSQVYAPPVYCKFLSFIKIR